MIHVLLKNDFISRNSSFILLFRFSLFCFLFALFLHDIWDELAPSCAMSSQLTARAGDTGHLGSSVVSSNRGAECCART